MIYLLLAIVTSAMVSIVMRTSEKYIKNNISMLCVNYLMCVILANYYTGIGRISFVEKGMKTAVWMGIISGFLYLFSFIFLQLNIQKNGVVLSATFMKLGVLVPTILSVIFFKERFTLLQMTGFCIALFAIVLINFEKGQTSAKFKTGLVILLLSGGSADAMSKIFEQLGDIRYEEYFLYFTFIAAFILCVILAVSKKQKINIKDIIFGLFLGVPNYLSARFLLKSLSSVPAVITYPTYSVATIVVVSIAGVFLFKENLSKKQKTAIVIILAALVFLNM